MMVFRSSCGWLPASPFLLRDVVCCALGELTSPLHWKMVCLRMNIKHLICQVAVYSTPEACNCKTGSGGFICFKAKVFLWGRGEIKKGRKIPYIQADLSAQRCADLS